MKKTLLLLLLPAALVVSCAAPQRFVTYSENSAYYVDPSGRVFTTPLISDVSVSGTRITFEQVFDNHPLGSSKHRRDLNEKDIEHMKTYTMAQAAFTYHADIIVYPVFALKTSKDASTITVTITGYPASYTNFRNATMEDFELINASEMKDYIGELAKKGIVASPCPQGCDKHRHDKPQGK